MKENQSLEIRMNELRKKFEKAWCNNTCYRFCRETEFNPKFPSKGQCFVTALCIQDIFGGKILCGRVGKIWHYWNKLSNRQEFDLTSDQFKNGDGIHKHPKAIKMFSPNNPNRKNERYLLLKKRLNEQK